MWSKQSFEAKSYDEKLKCLHEIVDPLKDQKASFKKAYDIITKPEISEQKLIRMYSYIFDTVEAYKEKKKTEKVEQGQEKLESMRGYLEGLRKLEAEESKDIEERDQELMQKLNSL